MSARNKRQLIGGLIGASIGLAAYALLFRNDGDGTNGLLLSFGLIVGGLPGFLVGTLAGILIGALVDLCFGRRRSRIRIRFFPAEPIGLIKGTRDV